MKKCNKCGEWFDLDNFYTRTADGRKDSYCKACKVKRNMECRRKNPTTYSNSYRKSNLKKNYGMTPEEYDFLFTKQKGVCQICGRKPEDSPRKVLFVDHCHASKVVRGLLCDPCNRGLGAFQDNIESLKNAITYLEANQWEAVEK